MHDSVVFVVGAAGGIGRELARLLDARGARLVLAGRDVERLSRLKAELEHGDAHEMAVLDARDMAATAAAIASTMERHGRIDGAVNLAGSIVLKPAHATSPQDFDDVIAQNLTTAFSLVRAAAPAMGKGEGGSIVLLSSAAARVGLMNHDAIAAAKAGVIGLALSAAATYAPRRVRVNVVAPGLVDTPLATRITSVEAMKKASEAMHPLGRIASADEVARAIAFFLEPTSSFVTGQVLGVDGGLGTVRAR